MSNAIVVLGILLAVVLVAWMLLPGDEYDDEYDDDYPDGSNGTRM